MSSITPVRSPALAEWSDDRGNRVLAPARVIQQLAFVFHGRDCRVSVHAEAQIKSLDLHFHGDGSEVRIGAVTSGHSAFTAHMRLGQDCRVDIGDRVTTVSRLVLCASEGASLTIGEDCMIASEVQIRTDDAHPIFDVRTGQRVNLARDVVIGRHVWLAYGARCLAGSQVGDGSVIGMGAVVTGCIPNNCVAAGIPARVVRRDVAWERNHLAMEPSARHGPARSPATRGGHWQLTRD
jgi:acetyltransferase-like isoleucine patch superfamily enzyme